MIGWIRPLAMGAMVGVVVLSLAGSALAVERQVWRHADGYFENTAGNTWVEMSPPGDRYVFREVRREIGYIDLYDHTRDCHVRLTPRECFVRGGHEPAYHLFYFGCWER